MDDCFYGLHTLLLREYTHIYIYICIHSAPDPVKTGKPAKTGIATSCGPSRSACETHQPDQVDCTHKTRTNPARHSKLANPAKPGPHGNLAKPDLVETGTLGSKNRHNPRTPTWPKPAEPGQNRPNPAKTGQHRPKPAGQTRPKPAELRQPCLYNPAKPVQVANPAQPGHCEPNCYTQCQPGQNRQ